MAFVDLYQELTGWVPKLDVDLSKKLINRAWRDIRRKNLWSFQLYEANWISPVVVNAGTVTTTQGTNTVQFDANAITALNPISTLGPFPTPLTQRQFRIGGASTIYNIWGWTSDGVMTLDRPYAEASAAGSPYMVYQCYYPAPYQDHLTWISIRDMENYNDLRTLTTRAELDGRDPQRSIFYLPTDCAYYQQNQNPNSDSYGCPTFELWGQPQYVLPYQLYAIRRGTPLVNDGDNLPPAIGEDCVIALGKGYAYEWAEANKGELPRAAGSDFRFLQGKTMKDYERLVREYRKDDRELVDNWYSVRRHRGWLPNIDGYFNAIANTANPGSPWIAIIGLGLALLGSVFGFARVPFQG